LLVVPYYNKPTQEGLYQHFKAIADAVPVAQILYNVPGRTITDLSNEVAVKLSEIDNIVAIKDATGDVQRGAELIKACEGRMTVLSGDDPTALELIKLGGKGNISVTANVVPDLMGQMCQSALAGDYELAESINQKMTALNGALFVESNPIPVKYATAKLGYGANHLRLPLTALSEQFEAQIDAAMKSARS
jgi:4-hydroxy-tetrahydrodipicolinate synthase